MVHGRGSPSGGGNVAAALGNSPQKGGLGIFSVRRESKSLRSHIYEDVFITRTAVIEEKKRQKLPREHPT